MDISALLCYDNPMLNKMSVEITTYYIKNFCMVFFLYFILSSKSLSISYQAQLTKMTLMQFIKALNTYIP